MNHRPGYRHFSLSQVVALLVAASLAGCSDAGGGAEPTGDDSVGQTEQAETFIGLSLVPYVQPNDRTYDLTDLTLNPAMNFITRFQDQLKDGPSASGTPQFKFISVNCPELLDSTPAEQEDVIKSVAQMGGQVIRTYTLSVNQTNNGEIAGNAASGKFILNVTANGASSTVTLNQAALVRFDNAIAFGRKYGVRLVVPLIDPYEYNGGIPAFLRLSGLTPSSTGDGNTTHMFTDANTFYTNTVTKAAYLDLTNKLLTRVNTVTGVAYSNDPAILAWQSGNEMPFYKLASNSPSAWSTSYDTWMKAFSAKIKTYTATGGTHPLVMDGAAIKMRNGVAINGGTPPNAGSDANLDIVDLHWYANLPDYANPAAALSAQRTAYNGTSSTKRPNVLGELGGSSSALSGATITSYASTMYTNMRTTTTSIGGGSTGVMVWSIRPHHAEGGFEEPTIQWTYHWPGFAGQTASTDETNFLWTTYLNAWGIRGLSPKLNIPAATVISASTESPKQSIRFPGVAGAYGYDICRSDTAAGPTWTVIGVGVLDQEMDTTKAIFADTDASLISGKTYYYRIRSRGTGGYSAWSTATPLIDKVDSPTKVTGTYLDGVQAQTVGVVNAAGQAFATEVPPNGRHYMVTAAAYSSADKLSEYLTNGFVSTPATTLVNDTFDTNPPAGATYDSGVSPGDGNASSQVGRAWINGSLFNFVTSNGYTNFIAGGSPLPTVSREIVADNTGVITYTVNSASATVLKLDLIGLSSLYGNLQKITEKWYYNIKWYEGIGTGAGSTPYPRQNQNVAYGYVRGYTDREPNTADAYVARYYVYTNAAKGNHKTIILVGPDGNWYMPTGYGSMRLMNLAGDPAIIAAAVPVFKVESSTDGINYTPVTWSFGAVGTCSSTGLDTWQGATINAPIASGVQTVRITINSPSVFEFETPTEVVGSSQRWQTRGIWLRNARVSSDTNATVDFQYQLDENYDGVPDSVGTATTVLSDNFGATAPAGATYSAGVAAGDGNASSLVGTSWINTSINAFVADNVGTNFMSAGAVFAAGMGREVVADTTGVATYSVTATTNLKMKLSLIGRTTVHANTFMTSGQWNYSVKWYEGAANRTGLNTTYDYLQAYKDSDATITAAAPMQYYVYTNAAGHSEMIFKALDGNWYMPTSYFAMRLMNQVGDPAIIAAAVPVFKVETSVDGINFSTVHCDLTTIGVCSNAGLDDWQAATLSANVLAGTTKVRVTVNSPSMFNFEDPNLDVYGKPQWMDHGIWLQQVTFAGH